MTLASSAGRGAGLGGRGLVGQDPRLALHQRPEDDGGLLAAPPPLLDGLRVVRLCMVVVGGGWWWAGLPLGCGRVRVHASQGGPATDPQGVLEEADLLVVGEALAHAHGVALQQVRCEQTERHAWMGDGGG